MYLIYSWKFLWLSSERPPYTIRGCAPFAYCGSAEAQRQNATFCAVCNRNYCNASSQLGPVAMLVVTTIFFIIAVL